MKKTKEILFQLTNTEINFCYGKKSHKKLLKKKYSIEHCIPDDCAGYCMRLEKDMVMHIVVTIDNQNNMYDEKSIAVHELSHAISFLMEHFEIKDDEFRSYALQFLYKEMMMFIDSQERDS